MHRSLFKSKSHFHSFTLQKQVIRSKKNCCVHHVSLFFPFLCPRANCSRRSSLPSFFTKERWERFTLTKEQRERFALGKERIVISLLCSQKTSDSNEKPKREFPTLPVYVHNSVRDQTKKRLWTCSLIFYFLVSPTYH